MVEVEKSAGVIIFFVKENEPQFLMLEYPTYWGFVRGRIEKNEKIEETIKREAKEEANVSKMHILPGFKHIQDWFYRLKGQMIQKSAIYFLAEIQEEESKNIHISFEHKSFRFCSIKEAIEIMRIKNERDMLLEAYKFIKENKKQKTLL